MSAWTAFGFGVLVGSVLFDQLWRWLYRSTKDLLKTEREYIALLEELSHDR